MRKLIILLFYVPLVFNTVNAQAFLARFTPASYAQVQLFAYFNVCAVLLGAFLLLKQKWAFTRSANVWIFFNIIYLVLALIGNIAFKTEPYKLLPFLIPIVYFIGFSILLSVPGQLKPLIRVLTIAFFCSAALSIVFNYFNIDMDYGGLSENELSRAGGVYGDANNSSVAAIFAFLLIHYLYLPNTKWQGIIRNIGLIVSGYSILITFSKTGFLVLLAILLLIYWQNLNFKRLIFTFLLAPLLIYFVYNLTVANKLINSVQQSRIESIANILTFQTDKVDYSSRDILLKNMFTYIEDSPFMGHGVQFANSIRGHNTIIGTWADAGIIGFLVFLAAWLYFFKRSWQSPGRIRFFTMSILITFFVFMITLQTIINQDYLMVVLALTTYLIHFREDVFEMVLTGVDKSA